MTTPSLPASVDQTAETSDSAARHLAMSGRVSTGPRSLTDPLLHGEVAGLVDERPQQDEQTRRYHDRPATCFAPADEKRRKQTVKLPLDVIIAIVRERLAYLSHGSDLDAVAQMTACEIERSMGVFPNLNGKFAAPTVEARAGGVRVAVKRSIQELKQEIFGALTDFRDMEPEADESWSEWYYSAFEMAGDKIADLFAESAILAALESTPAQPVREDEPVIAYVPQDVIDRIVREALDDIRIYSPTASVKKAINEAFKAANAALASQLASPLRAAHDDLLRAHGILQSQHREKQQFASQQFDRAERAESEIAGLREALKPFAKSVDLYHEKTDSSRVVGPVSANMPEPHHAYHFRLGDLRRARAALANSDRGQEEGR